MALLKTLTDDFNDASKGAQWGANYVVGTGVGVTETTRLEIAPAAAASGSNYGGYASAATYDLTDSEIVVRADLSAMGSSASVEAHLELVASARGFSFVRAGASLLLRYNKGGGNVDTTIAYSATQDAWWRIRHDSASGNILWDVAPDNGGVPGGWVNKSFLPLATYGLAITAFTARLYAGTFASVTSPGTIYFDSVNPVVNTAPTVTIAEKSSIGPTIYLPVGATLQLNANITDPDAADSGLTASWNSATPAAATVSAGGLVTAVAEGSSVVTASTTDTAGAPGSDSVTIVVDNTPGAGGTGFDKARFIIHALGGIV